MSSVISSPPRIFSPRSRVRPVSTFVSWLSPNEKLIANPAETAPSGRTLPLSRHFLVEHNRAKGARSNSERLQLGEYKLCRSDVRQEIESYDHIHRKSSSSPLCSQISFRLTICGVPTGHVLTATLLSYPSSPGS